MIKSQKGITLIALVITIIVLLILAGVSIAMLTGPNGLLTRANDAGDATEKAEAVEKVNTALQAAYTEILGYNRLPVKTTFETENEGVTITPGASITDATVVTVTSKTDETVSGTITYSSAEKKYTVNPAQ